DELQRLRVLQERLENRAVIYDFAHPVLRETLYAELGLARTRLLHSRVAEALEEGFGAASMKHADVLTYHFARGEAPGQSERAIRYLCAAGRDALVNYSHREAGDYLTTALERASALPDQPLPP